MHRHAYQGRKLSLTAAQRKALVRGQATSLVLHESIQTTEAKARELAPYFERLVTKAKSGTLAGKRSLESSLLDPNAVNKMLQELAPALADRAGGYTRITKLAPRRGDNASLAVVSIILPAKLPTSDIKTAAETPAAKTTSKLTSAKSTTAKTPKSETTK